MLWQLSRQLIVLVGQQLAPAQGEVLDAHGAYGRHSNGRKSPRWRGKILDPWPGHNPPPPDRLGHRKAGTWSSGSNRAFPGKRIDYPTIGAGLAGGDWEVIRAIINEELGSEDHAYVEYSA